MSFLQPTDLHLFSSLTGDSNEPPFFDMAANEKPVPELDSSRLSPILAALVRVHRRRFVDSEFTKLPQQATAYARRMAVLLRLSVLMHRGRGASHKPPMKIHGKGMSIRVEFPDDWLAEHPLTEAEIAREAEYLASAGFTLKYA